MENWLLWTLVAVGLFLIGFLFEDVRDIYEEAWGFISDFLIYVITFDWLSDAFEIFSDGWEAITNIQDSPILNPWFWVFYGCLMAGVWYLPGAVGVADYTGLEKVSYTLIFFIVTWFMVAHFQNN